MIYFLKIKGGVILDYIKEMKLEIEKMILIEVMENKGIKRYWIDHLEEWVYIEAGLWYDFFKLFRFIGDEIIVYQTEFDVSRKSNGNDSTIFFKSIMRLEYSNDNQLDEISIINLCKDFLSGPISKDYFCKNDVSMENRIVILEIIKEKNNTNLLLAHDLYNNNLLVLPGYVDGMKNKPEIGNVYIGHFEACINLNTFSVKSKLLKIVKELDRVNIYSYINKYYDCCDYPYLDFNKINEENISEDYYFLVRFSNSTIKQHKGKYQLKLGTKFMILENYPCMDYPEIEGKIYRGIALVKAIKIKNGKIKYIAIKLFNRLRDNDDTGYLNKKLSSNLTLSGIDIEDIEYEYYTQQEMYDDGCDEDYGDDYDLESDSITSSYIEYYEYDNEGEEFIYASDEIENDCSYDDKLYYKSSERDYYGSYDPFDQTRFLNLADSFDISHHKKYIEKNYNGKFYSINDISDPEFTINYEMVNIDKCTLSLNTYERIQQFKFQDKKNRGF